MADRIGQQLGNYRLIRFLGRGGFAEVYLGEHVHLTTQVAVKVLSTQLASEEIEAFRTEARTVARLEHPNIVRVFDFGIEDSTNTPYLVMSYAPNGTLRERHPKGIPLPLSTIVSYIKQIAEALQYAHDEKLIHRDIKPENMLVGRRNEVLLSDFGIALVAQSSRYQNTQEVIGTAAYMAPEQLQGKPRPASDQYALGIVVYEWLCGDRPFHGSFVELYSQQMFVPPPPMREKVPTISPDVERVVLTALAKDSQQRFARVQAFATALEQASLSVQPSSSQDQWTQTSNTTLPPSQLAQPTIAPQPNQLAQPTMDTPSQTQWAQPMAAPPPWSQQPQPPVVTPPTSHPIQPPITTPSQSQWAQPTTAPPPPSKQSQPIGTPSSPSQPPLTSLPDTPTSEPQRPVIARSPRQSLQPPIVTPSPVGFRPSKRGISRRAVLTGVVGLVGVGVAGGSIALLTRTQVPQASSLAPMHTPTPTATPTHTPIPASLGTTIYTYSGHSDGVTKVAWSPNGQRIASSSNDKTVQVWDATTGGHVLIYRGHSGGVTSVAWSPRSKYLASGDVNGIVQVWDATTGGHVLTYRGHSGDVSDVAWSPDGKYLASSSYPDLNVQVCDIPTGNRILTYSHTNVVDFVAWSPDGKYLASGGQDATVQVWDAFTGNTIFTYRNPPHDMTIAVWSPDSARIASGGGNTNNPSTGGTMQVWDSTTGDHLLTYRGHPGYVYAVTWSPNGKRIASGGNDKTVQIWEATTGSKFFTYQGHSDWVLSAMWSPEGKYIASGSVDKTVQVWKTE